MSRHSRRPAADGRVERRQWVAADLARTFTFFERAENLALITPPWLGFRVLTPRPIVMARGVILDYRVRIFGIPRPWRSLISEYDPPHAFRDVQLVGPYRRWDHHHRFRSERGGTTLEDVVVYELPFGPLGAIAAPLVRRQLDAIFDYRRARIDEILGRAT